MLAALIAGERDPGMLAELAKAGCAPSSPSCARRCRAGFVATMRCWSACPWRTSGQLGASIAELDTHIDRVLVPFARARDRLDTITGVVGKRAAECMLAELGVDLAVFPTAGHLASWRGAARATTPTGGKRRSGKPTRGSRWLGEVLTRVRLGGCAQPPHLPVGPVLAARPAHRQAGRRLLRWGTRS
jgi:transposase